MNYADHSREQIEHALDIAVSGLEMAMNYSTDEREKRNARSVLYAINAVLETQQAQGRD